MRELLDQIAGFHCETSENTIIEALRVVCNSPEHFHEAILEDKSIVLLGGGKGAVTVEYRD